MKNSNSTVVIDRYINSGLFVGMLLSVCMAIYSSLNLMKVTGPTAVAVDDNGVVVALFDRLIRMSKDGLIIHESKKKDLGINGLVNDIQPLANGDLIIGDGGSRSLYRCDSEMTLCASLNSNYDVGKYHKFYVDENNQYIILSNTERNELVLLNMDGSLNKTLIKKTEMLKFPDGITMIKGNAILLANALKRQVLKISITTSEAKIIETYDVNSNYIINGQALPMSISRVADNDWWVTAQGNTMANGASVIRFDENMVAVGRLLFDGLVHPVDVQDVGSSVLVADMHAHRVFSFDHDGNNAHFFGDSAFNSILDEQRGTKELSGYLRWVSIGFIVVLLTLALIVEGIRKKEKQKNEELERMAAPERSVRIVIPDSTVKIFRVMPIIVIVMMGASSFLLYGSMPESVVSLGVIELLMFIVIFVALSMIIKRIPKIVEVESDLIRVTTQKNVIITDSINNVSYANNLLAIKDDYFILGVKGALLKDKAGYEKLMRFLDGSKKLSTWNVQKLFFIKEKNSYLILGVVMLLMFILIFTVAGNDEIKKEKDILVDVVSS